MKKMITLSLLASMISLYCRESIISPIIPRLTDEAECDKIYTAFLGHYINARLAWDQNNKKESAEFARAFAQLKKALPQNPCTLSTGDPLEEALRKLTNSKT